jgi:hypothetical protein
LVKLHLLLYHLVRLHRDLEHPHDLEHLLDLVLPLFPVAHRLCREDHHLLQEDRLPLDLLFLLELLCLLLVHLYLLVLHVLMEPQLVGHDLRREDL